VDTESGPQVCGALEEGQVVANDRIPEIFHASSISGHAPRTSSPTVNQGASV
jgi:hypothetical protein